MKSIDGNQITTSNVPSSCPGFAYDEADGIARLLRRRRFKGSYVSNLLGQPVTAAMLREAQTQVSGSEEDGLPTTRAEMDKIPANEQLRRSRTGTAFKRRFDELEATPRVAAKERR